MHNDESTFIRIRLYMLILCISYIILIHNLIRKKNKDSKSHPVNYLLNYIGCVEISLYKFSYLLTVRRFRITQPIIRHVFTIYYL